MYRAIDIGELGHRIGVPKSVLVRHLKKRIGERAAESKSGCQVWQGWANASGYGCMVIKRVTYTVHRLAYAVWRGPVPEGKCVLHRCDNRRCVNPDHLFLGSHKDNNRDRARKGRSATGERNGRSKLKAEHVREIRRLHAKHDLSLCALARRYGVHSSTIALVLDGETWKDGKKRSRVRGRRKGTRHHAAKLTEDNVRAVRIAGMCGESHSSIARRFGISRVNASRIFRGEIWKSVI